MRDASALFPKQGPWESNLTEEQEDWWDWVVTSTMEARHWPSWKATLLSFRAEFPEADNEPPETTLKRALKRTLRRRYDGSEEGAWIDE